MDLEIIVWVCPTRECGNYYASSSAGDLRTMLNERKDLSNRVVERLPHSRCPACREAKRGEVDRVPVRAMVTV